MYNAVLEQIHQVLGNPVRNFNIPQTYIDKNDLWTGILAAAAFSFRSTTNSQKGYSPIQLIFGRDTILPIKYRVDWGSIRQKKQTQINKDNSCEKKNIESTMTIKSEIKSFSLNTLHTNMKRHIRARLQ